jgi:SAM-dependent methyltransferase
MNKFELVRQTLIRDLATDAGHRLSILDVGCRNCALKPYVSELARYEGVDLYQNPSGSVTHVLDVSKGLPFPDETFDYVVALDLVEHLDDFGGALDDLVRITRRKTLVMLPNLAHLLFRLRFLRSGYLSGKYELKYEQGQDRHRWVTTLSQTDQYMRTFAQHRGLALQTIWFNDTPKKRALATLGRLLHLDADFWVWASLYVLTRSDLKQ